MVGGDTVLLTRPPPQCATSTSVKSSSDESLSREEPAALGLEVLLARANPGLVSGIASAGKLQCLVFPITQHSNQRTNLPLTVVLLYYCTTPTTATTGVY